MTPEEIETRIAEKRLELLQGGNGGIFLDEENVLALRALMDEVSESDPLISLVPAFHERPEGSSYYQIRRMSAFILYAQIEAALADETLSQRALRFAEDIKRYPGINLPLELAPVFNKLLDEGMAAGKENPFLVEHMRATPKDAGYTTVPAAYAEGTLEACAIVLAPPEAESDTDEDGVTAADESTDAGSTDESGSAPALPDEA
jgi:hypothetical protein